MTQGQRRNTYRIDQTIVMAQNHHPIGRTIGLSLLLLLVSASNARAATSPEVRKALLKLYPVYGSAALLRDYANECVPTAIAAHQAGYDRWLQTHRLVGVSDLLRQSLSPKEFSELEQGVQQTALSKLRQTFPNCISSNVLAQLYKERLDPSKTDAASLATIQAALAASSGNSPAPTPTPITPTPPPSPNNPTTASLEGIYLEQTTGYGVGGGLSIDFDSYAVFQDGTISRDLNAALGGTGDRDPERWGRWQRNGSGFNVTWNNGKTTTLGGKLFYKTFAAASGDSLEGRYSTIGGGGNTALGGNVLTASWQNFTFYRDGRFEQGGSNRNSAAVTGNYRLDGHRIELRYSNGQTVRTGFYFFPNKGQKTADSIAIGNSIYSR
jgi:hypothetical protein